MAATMTTAPLIKNDPNSHLNYQHNIARETNEISTQQDHYSFLLKLILLSTCIFIDLILNATSEFQILDNNSINTDDTNNYYSDNSRKELHKKHILLCSLQIFSQVSTFAILFSQLCDTFPFKIGLLGTLLERFKVMLILHLIYILLTFIISGIRLVSIEYGLDLSNYYKEQYHFDTTTLFSFILVIP